MSLPEDTIYVGDNGNGSYDHAAGKWNIPYLAAETDVVLEIELQLSLEASVAHEDPETGLLSLPTSVIATIPDGDERITHRIEYVPVLCEGVISGLVEDNQILNTTTREGRNFSTPVSGNALPHGTEVGIIYFTVTDDPFLKNENGETNPYGWFRLTDRRQWSTVRSRFVAAQRVEGCEHLTYPFEQTDPTIIGMCS